MKHMRKLVTLVVVLAMVMAFMVPTAFADGNDGSIKVTNATAGQTYEAYLIFTATPSDPDDVTSDIIYTATAAQVAVTGFSDVFDTIVDANGNYTVTKKDGVEDDEVIAFVKNNIESLKQGSAITGTWTNNNTVTFSDLPYGYYYITSTLGTLVTIDTAGKNVSVVDKHASVPEGPTKKIVAEDSSVNEGQDQLSVNLTENAASVGTVETFQVDFQAVNWAKASADEQTAGSGTNATKVVEYTVVDTPVGLSIDKDSVVVKVNGTAIGSSAFNANIDANGVMTVDIPWVNGEEHLYSTTTTASPLIPVQITYNATVIDAAATATAPNTVEVKYNENVSIGTDTTTTYTYKFTLEKVDENNVALDGAEFELYYADSTDATGKTSKGDALTFTLKEGKYYFDPAGSVTHIAPTGTTAATAVIVGLDDANYVLKEVVVPAGYNKADDTAVTGLSSVTAADGATTVTVQNQKGLELPSTGGMGTTIFYILGSLMVVGAAVVLVTNKRMRGQM